MTARPSDQLLAWAAVGSRISGFHHDSASKLQSLMMALDEASELLAGSQPDVERALGTAMSSLRELTGLLTENRALAKAPSRKDMKLPDVLKRAAARNGLKLRGEVPDVVVHVAPASIVHALAMLSDMIAGPEQGARGVDVDVRTSDEHVVVSLRGTLPAAPMLDTITIATWLVEREDGAVMSAPTGFDVHLPTRARSATVKP